MEKKPIYLTTAIDYVNGRPHLGHAVEKIQADVLARTYRALGHDVLFVTGTDENSLSNVRAAQRNQQPVKDFVDANVAAFQELCKNLQISYDEFIRTTEDRHVRGAQKFWQALNPADIYQKEYQGLYCTGCEEYKMPKDLAESRCPEHPHRELEQVAETNYFFRLSAYQDQLIEILESNTVRIEPDFRKNEVLAFVRGGLEDLSISRSVARAEHWGIRVPGDDTQIMYVWVDALSNYLTALGYADDADTYQKFWAKGGSRIHTIGKGIVRFHAVYWLAFLLSAKLALPTEMYVHEYFTVDGQKMGKSIGNAIDPDQLVERYGVDATRYLLLASLPYGRDGDISGEKLDERYTADLANGLGNLVQRTLVLRQKFAVTSSVVASPALAAVTELVTTYHFDEALAAIWQLVRDANTQLEREAPWKEVDAAKRQQTLEDVANQIVTIATALAPFMPETADKIAAQLKTGEPEALFPRL